MKKEYRVKDSREFSTIMGNKKFFACPSFTIYVKEKAQEHARVGLSVGKKMGNAVVRNKVKRQVREMVHDIYTFEEDFDTIILVRPRYHEESFANNKKHLERLVKKVKIVK